MSKTYIWIYTLVNITPENVQTYSFIIMYVQYVHIKLNITETI